MTKFTVLYVTMVIVACFDKLNPSPSQSDLLNILAGAVYLISAATTLSTTVLISYRIHSFYKEDIFSGSRSRFKHIVEILVQSAVVYCLVSIAYGIVTVIPNETSLDVFVARNYTATFYFFTAVRSHYFILSNFSAYKCSV